MKEYFLIFLLSLLIAGCTTKSFVEQDNSENEAILSETFENITIVNQTTINLGYKTENGGFGNHEWFWPDKIVSYEVPSPLDKNNAYLVGKWKNNEDNMELIDEEGGILLIFNGNNVNMYAGSEKGSQIYINLDDNELNYNGLVLKDLKEYHLLTAVDTGYHFMNMSVQRHGFKIYNISFS